MAETRITNVVVPDIFTDYTLEPSVYRSRFWQSGVIQSNPAINGLLDGGGEQFDLPFFKDIAGTSGDIPVEGSDQTVNAITTAKQIALRQFRTKAWGSNHLASVLAGSNPMEAIANYVNGYWGQAYDLIAMATIDGVIADNVDNDSGDLVNDVSGGTGAAAYFSDGAVIDAQAKLGENGVVGRMDTSDYVAIGVHPATYAYMRKLDLIDYVTVSSQTRPIPTYMGMTVIVDRNFDLTSTVYSTYIFKAGALQFGISGQRYLPTETDRKPLDGFGIDQLITRRAFTIHPVGAAWQDSSVAGNSPTDAELAAAANWDRVYAAENMKMVVVKHKLP